MKQGSILTFGLMMSALSGCSEYREQDNNAKDQFSEIAFMYTDVLISQDLIIVSKPQYSVGEDTWTPASTVDDGTTEFESTNHSNSGNCADSIDWKATLICGKTYVFTQGYADGVTVTIQSVLGESSEVTSYATAEALVSLTSPLEGESYSVSTDDLVVSWPEYMGLQADAVQLEPCSDDADNALILELSEDAKSAQSVQLTLSDYQASCDFGDELDVLVYYQTEGALDENLAGGRFRMRIYSLPTRINLTD
ncbi:MAG TPA: hypothetical protein DEA26_03540 [Oceanospirillales bacterium]|nr:hypothetical protein [Oceanospirillaceae bacterium]HBS41728.1 hypothetical protein [Oceanospirillales bacterium]|tara:strand:- start:1761 stop:2516 length:756 start_codon:yes stop_codon:yes gene_type:complete